MSTEAGTRLGRFVEHKKHARRVRIGVMLVLCALPMAMALARTGAALSGTAAL